jgi:two-component system sensor histidine kinase UhpB
VYRIVQEALTNTAKHARASQVLLKLWLDDARLTATVSDDGGGFDVGSGDVAERSGLAHGVGLEGMRERAQLVGADLSIDSRLGAGTTVRVSVPVHEAAPRQSISP